MSAVYSGRGVEVYRERPIPFTAPMVRAILAGTKSMTRRVVRDPPKHWAGYRRVEPDKVRGFIWSMDPSDYQSPRWGPYGAPGDRLWVRETHYYDLPNHPPDDYPTIIYAADGEARYTDGHSVSEPCGSSPWPGPWRPSIYMPRWASRITLEITSVRVERVQEISGRDVEAEGVELDWDRVARMQQLSNVDPKDNIRASFATLWDSINGKRAPWSSNPWVWVIGFRRIEQ